MFLIQCILVSMVHVLSILDGRILGQNLLNTPIVEATLVGLICGDVQTGLVMGATLQLIFMGFVGIGVTSLPNSSAGTILAVAGALIGVMTTNPVIAAIGTCLGRGTVISIVLVMAVLPQILLIGDTIVERTSFDVKVPVDLSRVNRTASGNMRVSGRVRGYVNGVIDAEIKGTLNGTLKASVTSGTTIEPTKPDFYLPESKEQAAAEWAENYTEGEEV